MSSLNLDKSTCSIKKHDAKQQMVKANIIAIDGPSASGKGTISSMLATEIRYDFLDTGALYRRLALEVIQRGVDGSDEEAVHNLIAIVDFADLNCDIRSSEVSLIASKIATMKAVRDGLNSLQRSFALNKIGVVLDGRDIGTVIFPDAICKLYITAKVEIRANRRFNQLRIVDKCVSYIEVLQDLKERDARDSSRVNSPLLMAEDAFLIDTSELTPSESFKIAMDYVRARLQICLTN